MENIINVIYTKCGVPQKINSYPYVSENMDMVMKKAENDFIKQVEAILGYQLNEKDKETFLDDACCIINEKAVYFIDSTNILYLKTF